VQIGDGSCVRSIIKCPKGFKKVGTAKCIPSNLHCPPGYKADKHKNECVKDSEKLKEIMKCPKDFF